MTDVDASVQDGDGVDWPSAFERTDPGDREPYSGGFRVTRSVAFQNVLDELRGWDGVTDVQLDSGAEHQKRNPNKPYANASYDDPGVVVYFTKDGEEMAAACDRWDNPRDNAQDLYHFLHETRMQEQRGTVTAESEYEKLRLPSGDEDAVAAAAPPAHAVLGVDRDASEAEIREAWREKMKEVHPDQGGSKEALARVNEAKEVLLN
ncbi:J domain-containing protein [Halorubrum sp. SD626R]|uniref:J domain-containing protein n=1 Tax=Halorubrum sp. SD626R TaxID=1419722 RepID=UPI0010F92078|nr:J domain-containing protein [Halorubrum sp. SD626R]TKX78998.1 J domain-containing protein [Halorubrum sp. SD626R]